MGAGLTIAAVVGGLWATILLASALVIILQEKPQFPRRNRLKILVFGITWQSMSLIYSFVLLVMSLFRGREWLRMAASHAAAEGISKLLCTVFFGEVVIEGEEHIPRNTIRGRATPAIVAPNHSSMVDVLLCAMLPGDFTWVAKRSVFILPGIGQLLWMAGTVPLVRGKKSSALQMLEGCRKALDDGWSVLIYPQGTRNRRAWLPWKYGAFKLSIEKQVPIIPVTIVLPDDTWTNLDCKLLVKVHPPVNPPGPPASVEEMMQERSAMSEDLRSKMDAAIQTMTEETEKRVLSAFPSDHPFRKAE